MDPAPFDMDEYRERGLRMREIHKSIMCYLEYDEDPIGATSWWCEYNYMLNGYPLELLVTGELTYELAKSAIDFDARGME